MTIDLLALLHEARAKGFACAIELDEDGYNISLALDASTVDLVGFQSQVVWTRFAHADVETVVASAHLFLDRFEVVS